MSTSTVKWPILAMGAAVVVPLLLILASGFGKDPHFIPYETVGDRAADFALSDLDGKVWKMSELEGRPVVLNFWSTWCGPCKIEHPVLQSEPRKYPDVVFLGALYSDEASAARRFLGQARMALPYSSLLDPAGTLALDYGVSGVPETYFVNVDGIIVHKHVAPIDRNTLRACIELARHGGPCDPQLVAACDPTRTCDPRKAP